MIEYKFIKGDGRKAAKYIVMLDGKKVGAIKHVSGGFSYFPKGSKRGYRGYVFKTVTEVQKSLEEP